MRTEKIISANSMEHHTKNQQPRYGTSLDDHLDLKKKIHSVSSFFNKNTSIKKPIHTQQEIRELRANQRDKPQSFFKKLSSMYLKDAKNLGYTWRDLVKKDTRQNIINEINQYDSIWKQIVHKAKLDTFADKMQIKYKMDQYRDQYIKSYPIIPITIKDARTHELLLTNDKNKHKKIIHVVI